MGAQGIFHRLVWLGRLAAYFTFLLFD